MPYAQGPDLPPPAVAAGKPPLGPSQTTLDILAGKPLVEDAVLIPTPVMARPTTLLYVAGGLAVLGLGMWLLAVRKSPDVASPRGA
jgi:hypothetical protein